MIRTFVHIILGLVVLLSQWHNSLVALSYQLNYDYYANELCENKARPELHCDGMCFVAKQLKLSDESNQQAPPPEYSPSPVLFQLTEPELLTKPALASSSHNGLTPFAKEIPQSPFLDTTVPPPRV